MQKKVFTEGKNEVKNGIQAAKMGLVKQKKCKKKKKSYCCRESGYSVAKNGVVRQKLDTSCKMG